jgi:hypothetical protein
LFFNRSLFSWSGMFEEMLLMRAAEDARATAGQETGAT